MTLLHISGVLLLVLIPQQGLCIRCFQCNSAEHEECFSLTSNDTSSQFLQECSKNSQNEPPFCRKVETEIYEGVHKRTIRSCGWIKPGSRNNTCRKQDSGFIKRVSCTCFDDMCNGSTRNFALLQLSMPLLFAFLSFIDFR
ncbi:uncharacterized protein [Euwallacea fornicatus]|uniref:uncharacterized protein n=1 Tax=Euwallacea fornicatus TaxID=995702 RepID=UPI00338F246F